jgi:hypothetical protein
VFALRTILPTLACVLFVGCSSSSSTQDATTARDATMVASICGNPGDMGNAGGVGKYCVTIDDCADNTKATICSTIGNPAAYFCTAQCNVSGPADFCGTGAACVCADLGCGCTPNECIARLVDGGPGGHDASTTDAGGGNG